MIKRAGSMGLPLRGEIAFHFLRRAGHADPAQFLSTFQAAAVVPMENERGCVLRGGFELAVG